MDDTLDLPEIWLTSKLESGYGIDQSAESIQRAGLFVRGLEIALLSSFPTLKLPALPHLKLLLALAILPIEVTTSLTTSLYSLAPVGGLKPLLASGFVSYQSIKLLEMISNWRFERGEELLKNEKDRKDCVGEIEKEKMIIISQYLHFKSILMPDDESDEQPKRRYSTRNHTRLNYSIPEIHPRNSKYENEEDEDPSVHSKPYRSRRTTTVTPSRNDKGNIIGTNLVNPLTYMNTSIFSDSKGIWDMIGWAFACSTVDDSRYKERWVHWERFLTLLFNILEKDFQLEEKNGFLHDPIILGWIEPISNSSIFDAIFATVEAGGILKYHPIFPCEIAEEVNLEREDLTTLKQACFSSTGEKILRPLECNYNALKLRSKLLRLVLKQKVALHEDVSKTLEDISRIFMQDSWKHSCLLGTLVNYRLDKVDFERISVSNTIPSNLIMRIGWVTGLPYSLNKYFLEYIHIYNEGSGCISKQAMIGLLKCPVGNTIVVDEIDTIAGIYHLILNTLQKFNIDKGGKNVKSELVTAFEEGHSRRIIWIVEKIKKFSKSDQKRAKNIFLFLEEAKLSIISIINAI